MKGFLALGAVLAMLAPAAAALERQAFTATHYNLNLRVEPTQQRLSVRGKVTLRNDSAQPQRIAALQISSSLNWRSIRVISASSPESTQAVQFLTQPYTSDIDHTGELSEAIVTLPREIAPKESIELAIGYEGVVTLDVTRLTRIGTPETVARHSDWDQIGKTYSAVRGVGYVTWYPVALDAQNLLDGSAMFAVLGKWKARHAHSKMELSVELLPGGQEPLETGQEKAEGKPDLLVNAKGCQPGGDAATGAATLSGCVFEGLGWASPVIVIGTFKEPPASALRLHYLAGHASGAEELNSAADRTTYLIKDWFGKDSFGAPHAKPDVADLADADAAPYEAGEWLLVPLAKSRPQTALLLAVHQMTHAAFSSPRLWLYEGAAHFAQAVALEKDGRSAALDYLEAHRQALLQAEKTGAQPEALTEATQEAFYHGKAALVWWMLRDMVGDAALKRALHQYNPADDLGKDKDAYFEHLIETESKRDLAWFFHDWVYTDAGLPEFRIESANARLTNGTSFVTAVSVANEGNAGAEVTVTIRTISGDFPQRLEVRAKGKAVTRIASPAQPLEVVVNDGSVPESNSTEHRFKIAPEH
jgi:hypothetical protein